MNSDLAAGHASRTCRITALNAPGAVFNTILSATLHWSQMGKVEWFKHSHPGFQGGNSSTVPQRWTIQPAGRNTLSWSFYSSVLLQKKPVHQKGKSTPGALKPTQNKPSTCRSSQDHIALEHIQGSIPSWGRSDSKGRAKAKAKRSQTNSSSSRSYLGRVGAGAGPGEVLLAQPRGSAQGVLTNTGCKHAGVE